MPWEDCEEIIGPVPPGDASGVLPIIGNIGKGNAVVVDKGRGDVYVPDGSLAHPYKTLAAGIAALGGTKKSIDLYPGIYAENVLLGAGGFSIVALDRENTILTSAVDTVSGLAITDSVRLENLTIETTTGAAHSALNVDGAGLSGGEFLGLHNVTLKSSGTGFAATVKNMLSPNYIDSTNIICIGRVNFEALQLLVHGLTIQSIAGGVPGLLLKDCDNGFINDGLIIAAGGTSLSVDGTTRVNLRSFIAQTVGGVADCFEVINGAQIALSDFVARNSGAGLDVHVDATSGMDVGPVVWDNANIAFDVGSTIAYDIKASRTGNDSAVPGDTIKAALETLYPFGTQSQYASSDGESTTTAIVYQEKLKLTTPSVPAGDYRIGWSFEWFCDDDKKDELFEARVQVDDAGALAEMGIVSKVKDLGWTPESGFGVVTLTEAIHTIDIDYRNQPPNADTNDVGIRKARLEIWRVS